jgi:hypothetical protein
VPTPLTTCEPDCLRWVSNAASVAVSLGYL